MADVDYVIGVIDRMPVATSCFYVRSRKGWTLWGTALRRVVAHELPFDDEGLACEPCMVLLVEW